MALPDTRFAQLLVPQANQGLRLPQLPLVFFAIFIHDALPAGQSPLRPPAPLQKGVALIGRGFILPQLQEVLRSRRRIVLLLHRQLLGEGEAVLPQLVALEHIEVVRQFMLEQFSQLPPLTPVCNFDPADKVPQV